MAGFMSASAAELKPPNILFLFADDLAYDAVGFMGNTEVRTPTLDRLASSGTVFDTCYNSGAWHGAVCVASGSMLTTGRQLWTVKAQEKELVVKFPVPKLTWPQRMHTLGYRTFFTGKWHVSMKPGPIYDEVVDTLPGMPTKDIAGQYQRPLADGSDSWDASLNDGSGYWQGGVHWTVRTADHAIDLLKKTERLDEQFFLTVSFNAPHDPRQTPKEVLDSYNINGLSVPKNFVPTYPVAPGLIGLGKNWSLRDENLAPVPRTGFMVRTHRREYYSAITYLDRNIKRVLDALEASGKASNTLIVFTADHGLACGGHGLMGKQNMHEHSLRVPFFINGPGIPVGERRKQLCYLQDVVPTPIVLVGGSQAALHDLDFDSMVPALRDAGTVGRKVLYGAYQNNQRAVRDADWKLILFPNARRFRVYHLAGDPQEVRDLFETAEGIKQARRLFALLRVQQAELGDPLDLRASFPELADPGP